MIDLAEAGTCVGQVGINHGPMFPEKNWAGCSMTATRQGICDGGGGAMKDWASRCWV